MACEHPACSAQASTICQSHCHLSVCEQHRLAHETDLLNKIQKQLDEFSTPLSTLLSQTRDDLQRSEQAQQLEITRINALFDRHQASIDQRLKLAKNVRDSLSDKRERLSQHKTGEKQLTNEDYQQLETVARQIKKHLHEQYQLNHHIDNPHITVEQWPSEIAVDAVSNEVECIELTDSEDERSLDSTKLSTTDCAQTEIPKKRVSTLDRVRDCCPLTHYGVFGLQKSHNIHRFCSKTNNTPRYLHSHFTRTHRLKGPIATQLVKAIRNKCDPMETMIFPQTDDNPIHVEDIRCPFDKAATKFNEENSIPKTPCSLLLERYDFKRHLRNVHSITKANTELIYRAMVDHGTISHVQFEEDLCE